ncbi:cyclin-like protein [Calycina marina]|uniref:RNA polymerase II holoenzyme cyclin-like subunit n=1 Tax=Calycina marina TaxID=1763456 RepID=A0A9P8CB87_9HELO|nr:cyclin-like protein [Calycina marina]
MSEDERYRASTQFRLWSFTLYALHAQRTQTNLNAAARVRAAVRRVREVRRADTPDGGNGNVPSMAPEAETDCLTVEEEKKLIAFYCRQALDLGDFLGLGNEVKATAVQYIKRFYVTNSVMTYSPADILKTALFFATKTENHYFRLTKFAEKLPNTKAEDILALEFLLTQGLRFTFDVRHPYRALEGAVMELLAIANHDVPLLPGVEGAYPPKPHNMQNRVFAVHSNARQYLKISALLTDVYFHFTPSQIMMASLLIADSSLTEWFISSKFPSTAEAEEVKLKILATITSCADMLREVNPIRSKEEIDLERSQMKPLGKKLNKCRNPEKMDLVALQKSKREGDGGVDEKVIKKRKMEKEKFAKEGEDLFGPGLKGS